MKKTQILTGISILVFTLLFHKESIGLNLLLFELFYVATLWISDKIIFKNKKTLAIISIFLISAISNVLVYSDFSYWVHTLSILITLGYFIQPEVQTIWLAIGFAVSSIPLSLSTFFRSLNPLTWFNYKGNTILRNTIVFILPSIIILIFVIIYSASNPLFNHLVSEPMEWLSRLANWIIRKMDLPIIETLFWGTFISIIIMTKHAFSGLNTKIESEPDLLKRTKPIWRIAHSMNGLNNELKMGLVLFVGLNLVLLVLNLIDIYWVWFNFEWHGQYLKQFVHQGTYLLILSVLISVGLVIYFFRKNLNFYSKSQLLKTLTYVWIAQNAILIISVAIRNIHYINYFNLAYKRIGVFIFLIATLYLLYTVFLKVKKPYSNYYLWRVNGQFIYLLLVFSALFNWDIIIAKYNFNHSDSALVHLNFMVDLSDKALPYLDKSPEYLKKMEKIQEANMPQEEYFIDTETYQQSIENRKAWFIKKWEKKGILSWNWPEYKAYQMLQNNKSQSGKALE